MVQKPAAHFGGGARHTDQALALPAGFVVVQVGHDGQAGQSHAHFVRVGAHAPGVGIVVEVRRAEGLKGRKPQLLRAVDAFQIAHAGLRQREQADLVRVHGHPPFL